MDDDILELLSDETQIAIAVDLWDAVTTAHGWGLRALSLLVKLLTKFGDSEHFTVKYVCLEDFPPFTDTLVIERADPFEV